jgi:hypothetical protein
VYLRVRCIEVLLLRGLLCRLAEQLPAVGRVGLQMEEQPKGKAKAKK